ncbi:MAG: Patatin [Gemmatimonadetes bacterium]|nr:Patatin [Gemmatimonadota bacterium]
MQGTGRSDGRIGLALAGGVIEGGFYEVGVLCALQDAIEGLDCTALDVYVGVSAGAVITSLLANGVAPRTLSRAILSMADPVLNLDPDILFAPALREYARRVGRLPFALGRWLRRRLERPFDISLVGMLWELGELTPVGIFDSAPMERYLAGVFAQAGRTNDFRALRAQLRIVAVKLDSAQLVAFGDEGTAHVPISRAVQASIALPGLYCPVEIDGQPYIDGVAKRTLNASLALDEGVDLLFCVNPIVPVDLLSARETEGRARSLVDYGLPGVLSQTFRTMIHSRMGTGFRGYAHAYPDTDVVLIEPELEDSSLFFSNIFSFSNRRGVCEHAYRSTLTHLLSRADELEAKLAPRGLRLRRDVLADPARSLFGDDGGRPGGPPPTREGVVTDIRATLERLDAALDRLKVAV